MNLLVIVDSKLSLLINDVSVIRQSDSDEGDRLD